MGGGGGSGGDGRKGVQLVAAHVRGIQFIVEQADGLHAEVPRGKRQNRRRVGEQQKKSSEQKHHTIRRSSAKRETGER